MTDTVSDPTLVLAPYLGPVQSSILYYVAPQRAHPSPTAHALPWPTSRAGPGSVHH